MRVALAQPCARFTVYALDPGERGKVRSAVAGQAAEAGPADRQASVGPRPSSRSRVMSLLGALPKKRAYSRLNCDGLR